MNVDDDLEDIRWLRGLGGKRFPAAFNTLFPNLKNGLFFAIGEGLIICVVCFLPTREKNYCVRRLAVAHVSSAVL